ncbi:MAG: FHA domain-containing protein [Xenococcaceae cyanobacterium]
MVILEQNPYLLLHTVKRNCYLPLVDRCCWKIGRSKDNNLVIREPWVSRHHAMLQSTENGEFYLIDLGSRNGTFVNGRRVSVPVILHNADRISLGKTKLEFHCPPPARQANESKNSLALDPLASTVHVRCLMSVMVVDIRDFTLLARQLNENILSFLIGSWFRKAGEIIRDSGSWVDKYIGDAVMAIWFHGQKEVIKEELVQIFQAVSQLNKMTADLSSQYPLPFGLRIGAGVNTGYAMVGNTGSGDNPDYTAIGDTVNTAFRLESVTKKIGLDIALGETTYDYLSKYEKVQQDFHQYMINLQGYENPIITYGATFNNLDDLVKLNSG